MKHGEFWAGVLGGIALAIVWVYIHKRCPVCQQRYAKLRRAIGLTMIE